MATNVKEIKEEKRVDLHVPRGNSNDDPNLFISVNGVNYLLPKGKTSSVPEHVYDEYMRCVRAQERVDATKDRLFEESKISR